MSPRGRINARWWSTGLAWLFVAVAVLPFAFTIWTAQKSRERVDDSYYYLWEKLGAHAAERQFAVAPRPLLRPALNSLLVSTTCTLSCVVFGTLAGYAFAKRQFRGKAALFDLVLASMAVPVVILMMPLLRLTVDLRIYDTLLALILPFCVTGFAIFYMRYAISAVPDSIIEAGRLDGLSEVGIVFRVVLPALWPSVVSLAVLQFIASWNSFALPYAVIASPEHYTVGILLGRMMTDYAWLMWNDVMVVVIAALVPIALLFLAFNRLILKGSSAIGEVRRPEF